jgi:hypothetical protein
VRFRQRVYQKILTFAEYFWVIYWDFSLFGVIVPVATCRYLWQSDNQHLGFRLGIYQNV